MLVSACQKSSSGSAAAVSPPEDVQKPYRSPAMGWIRGSEWNFVAGRAYRSSYGFTEHLIVELWNQRVSDPCRKEAGSEWAVTLKTVAQVGEWALGSDPFRASPMIFFTGPTENWMAFQGFIGIDLIAETEVRGR